MSLAAAMRHAFPPDVVVAHAQRLLESATDVREAATVLQIILDRGYGKPLATAEITVHQGESMATLDWSQIEVDRRREIMSSLTEVALRAELADADGTTEH